jgi:hypothetical protein
MSLRACCTSWAYKYRFRPTDLALVKLQNDMLFLNMYIRAPLQCLDQVITKQRNLKG